MLGGAGASGCDDGAMASMSDKETREGALEEGGFTLALPSGNFSVSTKESEGLVSVSAFALDFLGLAD